MPKTWWWPQIPGTDVISIWVLNSSSGLYHFHCLMSNFHFFPGRCCLLQQNLNEGSWRADAEHPEQSFCILCGVDSQQCAHCSVQHTSKRPENGCDILWKLDCHPGVIQMCKWLVHSHIQPLSDSGFDKAKLDPGEVLPVHKEKAMGDRQQGVFQHLCLLYSYSNPIQSPAVCHLHTLLSLFRHNLLAQGASKATTELTQNQEALTHVDDSATGPVHHMCTLSTGNSSISNICNAVYIPTEDAMLPLSPQPLPSLHPWNSLCPRTQPSSPPWWYWAWWPPSPPPLCRQQTTCSSLCSPGRCSTAAWWIPCIMQMVRMWVQWAGQGCPRIGCGDEWWRTTARVPCKEDGCTSTFSIAIFSASTSYCHSGQWTCVFCPFSTPSELVMWHLINCIIINRYRSGWLPQLQELPKLSELPKLPELPELCWLSQQSDLL